MIKTFENFNKTKTLIHITSPEIAEDIKNNGFKPTPFIDYKYYSSLGKDGIYFYDNQRQAQFYAGFFMDKAKLEKVAMISVNAPTDIVIKGDKIEDGYFIKREDLDKVKVIDIKVVKYKDIY